MIEEKEGVGRRGGSSGKEVRTKRLQKLAQESATEEIQALQHRSKRKNKALEMQRLEERLKNKQKNILKTYRDVKK
jgi:hypothetical protein